MSTKVEESILVNVPISVAYNQWTQFEDFPQYMGGVTSVTQLSDDRLEWVAEIAGVKRQWEAKILRQVPDEQIAWAATSGATNAGEVRFEDVGGGQTAVRLVLEYEPEGLVEKIGDKLNIVENQAKADLDRFKAFIESEHYASGAWRNSVNPDSVSRAPGIQQAESSRGDSGKAGVSGKAVAAAVGVATAAGVGAVIRNKKDNQTDRTIEVPRDVTTYAPSQTTADILEPVGPHTVESRGIDANPADADTRSGRP
jgi:carbon monoxide dehydrogenase subunit G